MQTIDLHAHIIPQNFVQIVKNKKMRDHVRLVKTEDNKEWLLLDGRLHPLLEEILDPEKRIESMNQAKIDMQILSVPPPLYLYGLPDEVGPEIARILNDSVMDQVKKHPDRFIGLATLPMQNIELALKELERILSLGMKGVGIGTSINGEDYDHPKFIPFFKRIEELHCPIVFHPPHVPVIPRFKPYHLVNLIGNPLDTTIAIARIVFGGILKTFKKLKLCFVHGGGQAPYLMGRFDHGYKVREECKKHIDRLPSEYMKMLYYDTVTHDPIALSFLIQQVGADHVLIGSDHPYDMATTEPRKDLESLPLSEEDKKMIYYENAKNLFHL